MKSRLYKKYKDARVKPMVGKRSNIEEILKIKPKKEGVYWVVYDDGLEIRNNTRSGAVMDYGTLKGYHIKLRKHGTRKTKQSRL